MEQGKKDQAKREAEMRDEEEVEKENPTKALGPKFQSPIKPLPFL